MELKIFVDAEIKLWFVRFFAAILGKAEVKKELNNLNQFDRFL